MQRHCQCSGPMCRILSQFTIVRFVLNYRQFDMFLSFQISKLIHPVIINIMMTLLSWYYVYNLKTDHRLSAMFLFDSKTNRTTGNDLQDGMINAFGAMVILATVSFSMLLLALYDCRKLVQLWLHISCLLILFAISGGYFYDLLNALNVENLGWMLPCVLSVLYGGVGCIAFFSSFAPLWLHQFYVLANCSLVSLFYLRSFPGQTAWFVLGCVAIWDIFAVMSPIGPLRKVQEKAGDYSQDILRFMMFTANNTDKSSENLSIEHYYSESGLEDENESYCETTPKENSNGNKSWEPRIEQRDGVQEPVITNNKMKMSSTNVGEQNSVQERTSKQDGSILFATSAASALNDSDSLRLGMGDFVFYSVLVGQAATSGSFGATFAAAAGVIYGLCITLVFFTNGDETTPALPISIFLGSSAHFFFLALEPIITSYIEKFSL